MTPFGRYLTTLRLNRRIKQKDLAEALDVDPSYISAIENGNKEAKDIKVSGRIYPALYFFVSMCGSNLTECPNFLAFVRYSLATSSFGLVT